MFESPRRHHFIFFKKQPTVTALRVSSIALNLAAIPGGYHRAKIGLAVAAEGGEPVRGKLGADSLRLKLNLARENRAKF